MILYPQHFIYFPNVRYSNIVKKNDNQFLRNWKYFYKVYSEKNVWNLCPYRLKRILNNIYYLHEKWYSIFHDLCQRNATVFDLFNKRSICYYYFYYILFLFLLKTLLLLLIVTRNLLNIIKFYKIYKFKY